MENYLVNTFEDAVNTGFADKKVAAQGQGRINNLRHVDDLKDPKFDIDFTHIPGVSAYK